jgi:hypothetical protein
MAFGTDTVTQPAAGTDPTVYLHTLSMNNTNDLISCTSFYNLWQASGSIDRFARTVVDKLTTKFDADKGWLEWSADLLAQTRAYQTGAVPATAYTTELPFQGWRGTITKGASAFYDLQNFEWSIENHWEGVYTATASQDPGTMAVGAMSNKVKATFVASKTLYDEFLADTESAWVVTFTSAVAISNTYYHQVVITLPKLHMTKADRPTGDVYVKLTTDMLPLYDSSSSGAVTMTVQNTHAATDY